MRRGIPEATVARLPIYLRALTLLADEGTPTVSSEELAALAGVNSAKLRKDLSHLGSYGVRGVGYEVAYLVYQISRELGLTQDWPVAVVGIGNLGHALANYGGFASRGFSRRGPVRPGRNRCGRAGCRPDGAAPGRARDGRAVGGRRDRRGRHPGRRGPGGVRPAGRGRRPQRPELRARACCRCRPGSTCARSTCRPSCRSWPSTSSAARRGDRAPSRRGAPMSLLVDRRLAPQRALDAAGAGRAGRRAAQAASGGARAGEHVGEVLTLATCNRVELYADVATFHGGLSDLGYGAGRDDRRTARGPDRAPLRALRGPGGRPPVHRGLRAGLDGRRRGPDPRAGPARAAAGPGIRRRRPGAWATCFQQALRVGKRAHSETGIDAAGRSIVEVGIDAAATALGAAPGRPRLARGADRRRRLDERAGRRDPPARPASPG